MKIEPDAAKARALMAKTGKSFQKDVRNLNLDMSDDNNYVDYYY